MGMENKCRFVETFVHMAQINLHLELSKLSAVK